MGAVNLFRLFFGYVRFCARGGFPERFINLCGCNNIPLWDIVGGKRELYASTTVKGYLKIRSCAGKSGMLPRIVKRRGLPFWLKAHKNRVGLLLGAAASVICLIYLSTMVWTVDVQGNNAVPSNQILGVFAEMGVYPGCKKKNTDVEKLHDEGIEKLPQLSWLAVNLKGCSIVIEVREKIPAPKTEDDGEPQNLVAARDGVIAGTEVYKGKGVVKRGDAVLRGELLVNGVVTNYDSSVTFHHAKGRITAYTKRSIKVVQPFKTQALCKSDEFSRSASLNFFNIKIPLLRLHMKNENRYARVKNYYLNNDLPHLPVNFTVTEAYGCENKNLKLSKKQALALASGELRQKELTQLAGAAILKRQVTAEFTETECILVGEYVCEEEISVPQKISADVETD